MIKTLIVATLLSIATTASATSSHSENEFETVSSWYSQATELTFEESVGFYEGRCFNKVDSQMKLTGLLAAAVDDNYNRGPGFSNEHLVSILIDVHNMNNFNYSMAYNLAVQNLEVIAKHELTSPLRIEQGDLIGSVKKHNDSLVSLVKTSKDHTCTGTYGGCEKAGDVVTAGTIIWGCYFWEKGTQEPAL